MSKLILFAWKGFKNFPPALSETFTQKFGIKANPEVL